MTFESRQYLVDFKNGNYPKIHTNIYDTIIASGCKGPLIDLCCCYGLLGQRLINSGYKVLGIEGNKNFIALAEMYGVEMPINNIRIFESTFNEIYSLIKESRIKNVIARRCFPELFDKNVLYGKKFIEGIYNCGIEIIFIEGRIFSKRSVSKLSMLQNEVDMCIDFYNPILINNNIAILKRK